MPIVHGTSFSDSTVWLRTSEQTVGHVWYASVRTTGRLPSKRSPKRSIFPFWSRKTASIGICPSRCSIDADVLEARGDDRLAQVERRVRAPPCRPSRAASARDDAGVTSAASARTKASEASGGARVRHSNGFSERRRRAPGARRDGLAARGACVMGAAPASDDARPRPRAAPPSTTAAAGAGLAAAALMASITAWFGARTQPTIGPRSFDGCGVMSACESEAPCSCARASRAPASPARSAAASVVRFLCSPSRSLMSSSGRLR